MNPLQKFLLRGFALGLGLLFSATGKATTVIPPSFERLTDRAELIFVGKVVGSHAEWRNVGGKAVIFTLVDFEAEEIIKGEARTAIKLQFLGGTVGDTTLEVSGVPEFKVGNRELLFVAGNGVQFCPVVGVFYGKFSVRRDAESGREILVTHAGKELRNVAEIGSESEDEEGPKPGNLSAFATAEPLSLTDFKAKIHEQITKGAARK